MRYVVCILLSLAFVSATAYAGDAKPGELTDPTEILKRADAACKAVKTVKYDLAFEVLGADAARSPKTAATVLVSGFAYNSPEKFYIDMKITEPGASERPWFTAGGDGDMFFAVDHDAKKAYEDIDPQVVGSFGDRIRRFALMVEFLVGEPFRDEINGKSREFTGSEVINGEDCYVVHVVYATEREQSAVWYFSKKDFLPRRRVDEYPRPNAQPFRQQKTVANLDVHPKLDEDAFKLKLPEGYAKTDDFAP